jgi:hypothetical protein
LDSFQKRGAVQVVEFLIARLGEDEAAAKAATPGPWKAEPIHYGPNSGEPDWSITAEKRTVIWGEESLERAGDAAHIARHDPVRAIADVAAKRMIMRVHHPYVCGPWPHACQGCPHSGTDDPYTEHVDQCPVLRALACVYSDHADYDQEWAP